MANASLIDFTDSSWSNAITNGTGTTATVGNITLTASNGSLTFNDSDSERSGCLAGQTSHGLACAGDGIGIGNDEITESGTHFNTSDQTITISFASAVDISNVSLLDLFGNENSGEIAVIDGLLFGPPVGNLGISGGYYATGFTKQNALSIVLQGNIDNFSDFSLAALNIEVSPVPLPGALLLFGSALLGLFGFKRFS